MISLEMRELHSTKAIIDKILTQARDTNATRIKNIHLALGEISELDRNSIQQQWNELSKGTPLEQAQFHFRFIRAEAQCMSCFQKYHPKDQKILCPNCGSVGAKILSGEEFYLESIEADHE